MKKLLFVLLGVLTLCNVSFASFPVSQEQTQQTTTINETISDGDESLWAKMTTKPSKVDFVGFAVGFVFGLIGVGAVYLLSKDKKKRRSAFYGWGAFVLLVLGGLIEVEENNF
jgi:hypothetical protein